MAKSGEKLSRLFLMLLTAASAVQCQTTIGSTGGDGAGSTSRNQLESTCNTSLAVAEDSVQDFRGAVDNDDIFVYVKLVFVDVKFSDPVSAYLEDIGNVIDPLGWVWAKGGRGKLLLSSPFDFNQLSLTTLSPGVASVEIKIHGCIDADNDDGERVDAIAALLTRDLASGDEKNQTEDNASNEMLICLEKQLGKDGFPLPGVFYFPGSSYSMMEASTAFDCWPLNPEVIKDPERLAPTQYWLGIILAGGVVLALYSPMAMSFFIQKNPSELDRTGVERLSLVSDLPLGLKYVVCFWKNDNIFVASTRWTLFILIFTLFQYIPVLVSFVADMEDFTNRSSAFYRVGPINEVVSVLSHILVNLVFVIAAFVLLERFFRASGQSFLEPLLRERDRSSSITSSSDDEQAVTTKGEDRGSKDHAEGNPYRKRQGSSDSGNVAALVHKPHIEESNIAYKHIVLVEAPEHLWAPRTFLESSQAFFYYMGWRAKMGLDIKAWKFVLFGWLWGLISQHVGAPSAHPRTGLCVIIFAILYPLYLPFGLIFFAFNSLPLLYCVTRCLQTVVSNEVKCTELLFAFLIVLASVAWFFKFVATFVYIAELLGYSFMGFVVNAGVVGSTVLVVVIFTGYVVSAITGFYDGYCVLFSKVMKAAEEADKEMNAAAPAQAAASSSDRIKANNRARSAGAARGNTIAMTPIVSQDSSQAGTAARTETVQSATGDASYARATPLVTVNAKGIPSLELRLFWMIVEKYRPIRVQVGSTFFQLLVIAIIIGFGMSILAIADSLSELSDTVSIFSSIVIAGVIPTVLLVLNSPASQDCYNEANERQIKADISFYAEKGKLREAAQ